MHPVSIRTGAGKTCTPPPGAVVPSLLRFVHSGHRGKDCKSQRGQRQSLKSRGEGDAQTPPLPPICCDIKRFESSTHCAPVIRQRNVAQLVEATVRMNTYHMGVRRSFCRFKTIQLFCNLHSPSFTHSCMDVGGRRTKNRSLVSSPLPLSGAESIKMPPANF